MPVPGTGFRFAASATAAGQQGIRIAYPTRYGQQVRLHLFAMRSLGFPRALVLALLAGLALPFAFAPFELKYLAPLSLAALYLLLDGRSPRESRWIGWLYGVGYYGVGVHWIYNSLHLFGAAIAPLALLLTGVFVLVMTLFPMTVSWAFARLRGSHSLLANAFLFAGLWAFSELLRGVIMGGFPWILVGYSQTDTLLAALAPIGGVYFIGLVLVLLACLPQILLFGNAVQRLVAIVLPLALLPLLLWSEAHAWSHPVGERIGVRLAQAAIPQETKFSRERLMNSLVKYVELSRVPPASELAVVPPTTASAEGDYIPLPAETAGVDVVIWPETAIPTGFERVEQALAEFVRAMERRDIDVLSGGFFREEGNSWNSIGQLTGERQLYRKRHLVPFGEYMPLRFILDHVAHWIDIPMSDLSPGEGPMQPMVIKGVPIGLSICYEDVYGEEMRFVLPAATLLVNVSNDAWFGQAVAPHQHEQKARMRALEFSRPLIRVTNTGVSSAISHDGQVYARIGQEEMAFLDVSVQPRDGTTPFMSLGNGPVWGLSILAMAAGAWVGRRRSNGGSR
ncbi:MAG: apolipoprotein N-acyltransferase [Gammaproteobacteria bacterium]|nr:MAG: apolipoprotein N-acyltransferase [Gammaproteobacteria bacterium]